MSDINDKEEWGNIELPGLSDEELYKKNWNMSRKSAELVKDESWKNNHRKGCKIRSESNWRENVANANKKKYTDEYLEKHRERMKIRSESTEWLQKTAENGKKRRKKVMTPDGIFDSRKDAAEYYQIWPGRISVFMKQFPDKYYYITE